MSEEPGGRQMFGGLAAALGVCCSLHVIVLLGGFAVVFGNPYVITALVVVAAVALGMYARRRILRRRS